MRGTQVAAGGGTVISENVMAKFITERMEANQVDECSLESPAQWTTESAFSESPLLSLAPASEAMIHFTPRAAL
eukprot:4533349-Amphidinium_carterae.1